MSTPSTATITVPPSHQYYSHSTRYLPTMNEYTQSSSYQTATGQGQRNTQAYPTTPTAYASSHVSNDQKTNSQANIRQSNSQTSQYYDALASIQQAPQPSQVSHPSLPPQPGSASKKRGRDDPVDWEQYFGGRPPKEIIVIDDDDSPAPRPAAQGQQQQMGQGVSLQQNDLGHMDKRRKTGGDPSAGYDAVYRSGQYSNTHTPYDDYSSHRYTGSTDRTAPYLSTAPTSLGSTSSGGTYVEDASVGQKRKRSTRQAATAVDVKRKLPEIRSDPYTEYIPPPRPPIKAKDVHVAVIPDVRQIIKFTRRTDTDEK